jgi:hypothetical protein
MDNKRLEESDKNEYSGTRGVSVLSSGIQNEVCSANMNRSNNSGRGIGDLENIYPATDPGASRNIDSIYFEAGLTDTHNNDATKNLTDGKTDRSEGGVLQSNIFKDEKDINSRATQQNSSGRSIS